LRLKITATQAIDAARVPGHRDRACHRNDRDMATIWLLSPTPATL
jgi:hypothetical protein